MEFGVCVAPDRAPLAKEAGADFIEGHVQQLLKPADPEWSPPVDPHALAAPLPAYNCFFPGSMKLSGPEMDLDLIRSYAERAFHRAAVMRSELIVLGSGGARRVPDGTSMEEAERQFIQILRAIGPLAEQHGVTVVIEPLRQGETNFINTYEHGLRLMRQAQAPGVAMLVDFYHLAVENEPLENLDGTGDVLLHAHIAEPEGRVAPAPGGTDFRPFFAKLKEIGYDRRISIECGWDDIAKQLGPTLDFLRGEWDAA